MYVKKLPPPQVLTLQQLLLLFPIMGLLLLQRL
jgi:hypothetical protein